MESILLANNAEKYDKAVHGGLDSFKVLAEGGDLAIYIKPRATVDGNPGAVITFTVMLPDGSRARAQAATTVANLMAAARVFQGWIDGGHL